MNALVIGVRRTGKSTLAYFLAVDSGSLFIVIWDPNNNFRAFPAARSPEELDKLFDELEELNYEDALKIIPLYGPRPVQRPSQKRITLRYVPHPNHLEDEFAAFSEVVRRRLSGHYAVLIDESDEAVQSRQQMTDAMAWWMRRAPTEQDWPETVEVVQMTHSPQDVYTRARNLITDVYAFRTNGQPELEWLEAYTQNPEIAERVRTLSTPTKAAPDAPRHVLHIFDGPGGEKEYEVLTDASVWYIQIGSNRGKYADEAKIERERMSADGEGKREREA
jgi:hypothetical protein